MLCQNCNKREATTYVKQTVNGEAKEAYLCPECAREAMGQDMLQGLHPGFGFDFPSLFQSMFSFAAPGQAVSSRRRCNTCGSTFDDIVKSGRAGCSDCYELFYEQILPSVEQIHGKVSHVGKIPVTEQREPTKEQKISALESELKNAVAEQEFEQAAKLRDEIRELREQGMDGK